MPAQAARGESSVLQFVSRSDSNRCVQPCAARPVESLTRALPAWCLSGLSGGLPPLPPDYLLLTLSQLWDPELSPTQVSLLEAPRSPAQPLSWPPPMACFSLLRPSPSHSPMGPWAWGGAGEHISGQEAAWEASLVCSLYHHPHPAHNQESKGGSSSHVPCPYSAQGCRGERLLMFSPEKRRHLLPHASFRGWPSPHPHRLEGLPKVTQCPLAVSPPSPLLSSLSSVSTPN